MLLQNTDLPAERPRGRSAQIPTGGRGPGARCTDRQAGSAGQETISPAKSQQFSARGAEAGRVQDVWHSHDTSHTTRTGPGAPAGAREALGHGLVVGGVPLWSSGLTARPSSAHTLPLRASRSSQVPSPHWPRAAPRACARHTRHTQDSLMNTSHQRNPKACRSDSGFTTRL